MTSLPHPAIIHNQALRRFELHEAGETAFLSYEMTHDSLSLIHTEVPPELRGKGVGSKLVEGVLQIAEEKKLKVTPLCPFVIEYLKAHPQHLGVVEGKYKSLIQGG